MSDYQKVEYLQSSGMMTSPTGPYINTGYKAVSENYQIKSKFIVMNLVHNTVLFGGGSSTDIISAMMTSASQLKFYVGSGSVSSTLTSFTIGTEYEMECTANNGNLTVTLNGTSRSGAYSGTINKDYPLFIFANNSSGTAAQYSSLKVYWFQIYDNGILVRDFVPCYRKSDNVAGLYDKVNGVFYTNAGTGTFTLGPDVAGSVEPDNPSDTLIPIDFYNAMLRRRLFSNADAGVKIATGTVVSNSSVGYTISVSGTGVNISNIILFPETVFEDNYPYESLWSYDTYSLFYMTKSSGFYYYSDYGDSINLGTGYSQGNYIYKNNFNYVTTPGNFGYDIEGDSFNIYIAGNYGAFWAWGRTWRWIVW